MKKVKVEQAVGMELCHDITQMREGFKGPAFRRGHVIRPEDVEHLLNLGKTRVFVGQPEPGQLHEEECALRMAAMCPVEGAEYTGPSEGKVVLTARQRGFFRVDRPLLRQLNAIGDLTICTLPDHYPVEAGARLASMRIVPLVTQAAQIEQAEALCARRSLLRLLPYRPLRVGAIITGSEVYSGRIQDRFGPVLREKLARYPGELLGVSFCDDDPEMIQQAARDFLSAGAELLIFTGGLSVDPDDVTPAAIRQLGAEVISHGVPSQPGNMTLVAYLGKVALLGVPGAAISLPTTLFDVLLPQVFAGEPITRQELLELGDGGLCQLCDACHWPNCTFGRY